MSLGREYDKQQSVPVDDVRLDDYAFMKVAV